MTKITRFADDKVYCVDQASNIIHLPGEVLRDHQEESKRSTDGSKDLSLKTTRTSSHTASQHASQHGTRDSCIANSESISPNAT